MSENKSEITIKDILKKMSDVWKYLLSKWKTILFVGLLGGVTGLIVSFFTKPTYSSELIFVLDESSDNKSGGLASLATNFGISGGSSASGIFSSSNIIEFLKTRSLIEKALLMPISDSRVKNTTFAQLYIDINELNKKWDEKPQLKNIKFKVNENREEFSLHKDSILGSLHKKLLINELKVSQPNEENSILKIQIKTKSEVFSKNFPSQLIEIAAKYYAETKTKKSKLNVKLLQKQVDSVRLALFNSISGAAVANDQIFGLNPSMNIQRVPSAKKQVDIQANTAILTELVKNLEISKMTLLNQTPIFEVIDRPIYPLEKEKFGKIKGIVLGGIIFGFIISVFILVKRFIKNIKES